MNQKTDPGSSAKVLNGPCYMVRVKGNKRHMMPWPKKAALHSLSHIRHQRDAGGRPGGNARPYPGFFLPGPGPGYAQERKNIFQIAKGRKNTPS